MVERIDVWVRTSSSMATGSIQRRTIIVWLLWLLPAIMSAYHHHRGSVSGNRQRGTKPEEWLMRNLPTVAWKLILAAVVWDEESIQQKKTSKRNECSYKIFSLSHKNRLKEFHAASTQCPQRRFKTVALVVDHEGPSTSFDENHFFFFRKCRIKNV